MRNFGDIDTARLRLCVSDIPPRKKFPEQAVSITPPLDHWHAAINYRSYRITEKISEWVIQVTEIYKRDFQRRREKDGRVINPQLPVEVSRGVLQVGNLIESAESEIKKTNKFLDYYRNQAEFGLNIPQEEMARENLRFLDKLIPRVRLFLHSYLWLLWMRESLEQVDRLYTSIQRSTGPAWINKDTFNFIAHPSIVVSVFACTSLIEEVGAKYINSCTSGHIHRDNTSPGQVLSNLQDQSDILDQYDIDHVREFVIDTRNEIAHYILQRVQVVETQDFKEFFLGILEGEVVVRGILNQLMEDLLRKKDGVDTDLSGPDSFIEAYRMSADN